VNAAEVVGAEGESLLELLLAQLLFSATIVVRVTGADIERFNTEYRYARHHNNKPLFKSASGAIIYWGGTQWRMNYCDKTAQSFYCAAVPESGLCAQLPPSSGVSSAAIWTTAGWRSQYRAADHSCPTLRIFKEVTGAPRLCGDAVLACAKMLRANGIASLGSGPDVPDEGVLRISALTSAAYDAQEKLTPLPGVNLGRSFHELLEAFGKAHTHADDLCWNGDWQMGFYANGNTWASQIINVRKMEFSVNGQAYKLTGQGYKMECEWFDNVRLTVGHLSSRAVTWIASLPNGGASSQRVVWVRRAAPLDEAEWGGDYSDPSAYPAGLEFPGEADDDHKSYETWQRRVVKINDEAKILRLEMKPSESCPRAAVGALAAACLLMEKSASPVKLAAESSFEDCLRIIMHRYYLLHSWEFGLSETDKKSCRNALLADDQVDSRTLMQRHAEAALNEATLPQGPIPQAEAIAQLLGDARMQFSLLSEEALVQVKDQRVTALHAFVRDVAVMRAAVTPATAGKPVVRWAPLAQVTRLLDTALGGVESRGLRDAWMQWLFSNLARPDISGGLQGRALHLALRCPGLAMRSAALPLLQLGAGASEKDSLGVSATDILRARAADLLTAMQLSESAELAYAMSLGPGDAPEAGALAAALAEVENDASLGLLWQVQVLSKQERFWSTQVQILSSTEEEGLTQEGQNEDPSCRAPPILVATSPNGMCEPEGEYVLDLELTGNGQPVWKKSKGMLYWMYSGKSGKWHLGSNECRNMNFNCDKAFLYRNLLHNGKMPHAIGGCWKRWDGIAKKWFDDADIKITDCPLHLGQHIQAALDALYEIRPSQLVELGRLDMASERTLATFRAVMTILDPSESWRSSHWDVFQPLLRSEERAAEFLQRILEFGNAAISEAQARRLEALLVEVVSAPDSIVIAGAPACAALLQWAHAVADWQRYCAVYGAELVAKRLAISLVEHISGNLSLAKLCVEHSPREFNSDDRIISALRVLMAATEKDSG